MRDLWRFCRPREKIDDKVDGQGGRREVRPCLMPRKKRGRKGLEFLEIRLDLCSRVLCFLPAFSYILCMFCERPASELS